MKKNVMMRVASALLVAVLMTTCAISGTFAKYTSSKTTSDNARVAVWGLGVNEITIEDMFLDVYSNVDSQDGDDVVAPGTSKQVTVDFITAAGVVPEVAYTFVVEITVDVDGAQGAALLSKLDWTVNGTAVEFEDGVAKAVLTTEYAAGTAPADLVIKWEWPFEVGENADEKNANNATDTTIGNGVADIEVTVTYTATQK